MNKKWFKKISAVFVVCLFFLQALGASFVYAEPSGTDQSNQSGTSTASTASTSVTSSTTSTSGTDSSISNVSQFKKQSYEEYTAKYKNQPSPNQTIIINGKDFTKAEGMDAKILHNFESSLTDSVQTGEEGFIEWEVDVPTAGMYNIGVKYYPTPGKTATIERELQVDGDIPFEGARTVQFQRIWKNASDVTEDSRGNEYRPSQVEAPQWREVPVSGQAGYNIDDYKFYFSQGKHTIRLTSVKEPMAIEQIKLYQEPVVLSYSEVKKQYDQKGYKEASGDIIKIQAEDAKYKSDSTLAPLNDNSSPSNEPYSTTQLKINTIGSLNWKYPMQWLEWEISVPQDGLYKIGIKAKQNFNVGMASNRKLSIDGKVPFKEAEAIKLKYTSNWVMTELESEGQPCLVYLTKGTHTLRLENTLGDISEVLKQVDSSILELNTAYRKIVMVTGPKPEAGRDYNLGKQFPTLQAFFADQSAKLKAAEEKLVEISGGRGEDATKIEKLVLQTKGFGEDLEKVTSSLEDYRNNISVVSNWLLLASEQPLLMDYIVIAPPSVDTPRAEATFWQKVKYEFSKFFVSFVNDYTIIGASDKNGPQRSVTLWVGQGRDQAQVLKLLGDNYFVPQTDIQLNLRLVDMSVLLPSVAAGKGPDVAIIQSQSTPVNYALRDALYNLSNFPDRDEVLKRFAPGASVPFWIGDDLYALPEQQTFPMLFYRKDVLQDLGLSVPQTWDEVYEMIPKLQKEKLDFGFPTVNDTAVGGENVNATYLMFLLQQDGQIYNDDRSRCILDAPKDIDAFIRWTELYTKYRVNVKFDGLQYFRTGQIPIQIAGYNFYNSLAIGAPEIKGLWDFTLVPGVKQADGTIRREVGSAASSCFILGNAKDKDASWEFLKWWTSTETQVRYGLEMEALQGASARWPTANIDAMWQLPWPASAAKAIQQQRQWAIGIPEVPGGYMMNRNLENAALAVINQGASPRESLLDWNKFTNDEIKLKRQEFGLE